MRIYDITKLAKGTKIVAQRGIPGPTKRYPIHTVFTYKRSRHKSVEGYVEIFVLHEVDGQEFITYDDYFKFNTDMKEYVVTITSCMFDET